MTIGISPKVQAFMAAIGGPGLLLLVLGLIIGDAELRAAGIALLTGAVVGGGAGYRAPAGQVLIHQGPPSDELLPPETLDRAAGGTPAGPLDELELEE